MAGVQFGLLGRFRTPSAPQRGSLLSSQANTAGEFLYRVTTALTFLESSFNPWNREELRSSGLSEYPHAYHEMGSSGTRHRDIYTQG